MRLPNSYGSVYKLAGKRRKPWTARKTIGWKPVPEKSSAYPIYKFIGYYKSKAEALEALALYNANGAADLDFDSITFSELYEKWSDIHFEKVKSVAPYKISYKLSAPLHNMQVANIKLGHLQNVVDESRKNTPTLKNLKNLWGLMWDFAVQHEVVPPSKREIIKFVDITKPGNPNAADRKPFTQNAIKTLWNACRLDENAGVALILIYTGMRIGELLELKKEDVHLEERWLYVRAAKTSAGVREVPIAEKIVPLFRYWEQKNSDYLICSENKKPYSYNRFYNDCWIPIMYDLSLYGYTPHCARHTCISLLTEAGVDERVIQKIVGHKGNGVTQVVYTHLDLPSKLDAINKI